MVTVNLPFLLATADGILSPPLSHAVGSESPFLSLALASHPLMRISIKLNLKLPPVFLINVYIFFDKKIDLDSLFFLLTFFLAKVKVGSPLSHP